MLDDRFWRKVNIAGPDECWLWMASRNNKGYGLFSCRKLGFKYKTLAHRLSYMDAKGPIRQGRYVLHSCDNPACVNPSHLRQGTQRDNMRDAAQKNRTTKKITDQQAISLMKDYIAGMSHAELASRYGLRQVSVSDFTNGKARAWLLGKDGCPSLSDLRAAKRRRPGAKIDKEDVRAIKTLIAQNVPGTVIAARYGIHPATVSDIRTGKTWRDV